MAKQISEFKYPNHLRELIDKEFPNVSTLKERIEAFGKRHSIGYDSLHGYVYGTAKIPTEVASKIANDCDVSVDWLMCRLNDYDVIEILRAFSAILRVKSDRERITNDDGSIGFRMLQTLYRVY